MKDQRENVLNLNILISLIYSSRGCCLILKIGQALLSFNSLIYSYIYEEFISAVTSDNLIEEENPLFVKTTLDEGLSYQAHVQSFFSIG